MTPPKQKKLFANNEPIFKDINNLINEFRSIYLSEKNDKTECTNPKIKQILNFTIEKNSSKSFQHNSTPSF